jgi:hypothetical protein
MSSIAGILGGPKVQARRLVIALSIVALTIIPGSQAAATDLVIKVPGDEVSPSEAKALRLRQTFGFDSSLATIRRAEEDPRYSADEYGVPLSKAEIAEMERRAQIQLDLREARHVTRADAHSAGNYLDQAKGALPVFLFTDDPANHINQIRDLVPNRTEFLVRQVTRTRNQLDSVQDKIDDSWDELRASGIDINLTGIDTSGNTVVVGVSKLTPEIEASMQSKFGDGLSFRESPHAVLDACNSVDDCRPMKGGIHIYSAYDTSVNCTAGFIVRRTQNNGQLAVLTAGHCVELGQSASGDAGVNTPWRHNGNQFGLSKYETWHSDYNADVGLVGLDPSEVTAMTTKNRLFTGSTTTIRTVVDWFDDTEQSEGDQVSRYGLTSHSDTGVIVDDDITHDSCKTQTTGCRPIRHTTEVDFDSTGGDSGGPYYLAVNTTDRIAMGTHVHSDPDAPGAHGWYSSIDWGRGTYFDHFGDLYSLCVTSAC